MIATLLLTIIFHLSMYPSHEDELTLPAESNHFKYYTSTFRNRAGNRCALIRCGNPFQPRTNVYTTCDKFFIQPKISKTNHSQRLCALDYINSHWDALSLTYNEGIAFVSDNIQLRVDTRLLPLEGKHVHFSFARNAMDIGAAWFSVFPNNQTRVVFRDWAKAAFENKALEKQLPAPEQASLNRVRNCKGKDVVCHSRHILIAYQCDGIHDITNCVTEGHSTDIVRAMAVVVALTVCIRIVAATGGTILTRRKTWSKARIWQLLMIPGQTRTGFNTFALVFLAFGLLAALPWTAIVDTVGKGLGTKIVHRFEATTLWGDVDVYRSVPDLRGTHDGHSYIFKDGHESVRVSGSGMEIVVWLTGFALFLRDVVHGGVVLRCLLAVVITKMICGILIHVIGSRRKDLIVNDEDYYDRRAEIATKFVGKGKGRSFVVGSRDRLDNLEKQG